MSLHRYKLVLTIALEQECPKTIDYDCLDAVSLKALQAGDTRKLRLNTSALLIITGVGMANAISCAQWINHHLNPELVLNLGSAASNQPDIPIHTLCQVRHLHSTKHATAFSIWDTCPVYSNKPFTKVDTLYSLSSPKEDVPKHASIIDMEAAFLGKAILDQGLQFCCIKYITDHNDANTDRDFTSHLAALRHCFQELFDSLFGRADLDGISVIIPTFNRASYLARSIDSVLYQTNCKAPIECIVVDDASTDLSSEIVNRYNNEITYIRLETNKGVSAARNTGALNSRYQWLAFLDSDDEWAPQKLSNQLAHLSKHPYYQIIQSNEQWIRHGQAFNKRKHHQKKSGFIWQDCLARCMITPSSVMINKAIYHHHKGFDENLALCEDYDLWLTLSRHYLIGLVAETDLIKYGGHSDQLSNSDMLDHYRVQALLRALQQEQHPEFGHALFAVLSKKLSILMNGCKKRAKNSLHYQDMLKQAQAILAKYA